MNLLKVENLSVSFETDEGVFKAVDDVSFGVEQGQIVGLVGESGCGKSVTALSILRLIPDPPGRITAGRILWNGRNLLEGDLKNLHKIRGRSISMIFQEPTAALSPLQRIGRQLVEALQLHRDLSATEAWQEAAAWLRKVRIPDAPERMFAYPHQLSGGMQQRVMIAMALMLGPELIIADEPTTALDVTTQAQIFRLLKEIRDERTAVLLITHDMGVIWQMCDRVVVMYAARIAEQGSLKQIFEQPSHPYTRGLLKSIPKITATPGKLKAIAGQVPSPFEYPSGCHFRDRCPHAFERCARERPALIEVGRGHRAACFLARELVNQREL